MKIQFPNNENKAFDASYRAQNYLKKHGFSVGSMCGNMPIGIYYGDAIIAKWRNLSEGDIAMLHGTVTSDDFRESGVTVEIDDEIAVKADIIAPTEIETDR